MTFGKRGVHLQSGSLIDRVIWQQLRRIRCRNASVSSVPSLDRKVLLKRWRSWQTSILFIEPTKEKDILLELEQICESKSSPSDWSPLEVIMAGCAIMKFVTLFEFTVQQDGKLKRITIDFRDPSTSSKVRRGRR